VNMSATKKFRSYACRQLEFAPDGAMLAIQHHQTIIFRTYVESGRTVWQLDTGGHTGDWHGSRSEPIGSVTTKRKLNEIARHFGHGFSVHQHRLCWYVTTKAGVYKWDDSTTFCIDAETGMPFGVVRIFTEAA